MPGMTCSDWSLIANAINNATQHAKQREAGAFLDSRVESRQLVFEIEAAIGKELAILRSRIEMIEQTAYLASLELDEDPVFAIAAITKKDGFRASAGSLGIFLNEDKGRSRYGFDLLFRVCRGGAWFFYIEKFSTDDLDNLSVIRIPSEIKSKLGTKYGFWRSSLDEANRLLSGLTACT
jgi:hypothetical protein